MKKFLMLLSALLIMMLCACQPSETPVQTQPQSGLCMQDGALCYIEPETMQKREFSQGLHEIDGKTYLAELDGTALASYENEFVLLGESLYYLEKDHTLRAFSAGVNEVGGFAYYAPADGFALAAYQDEILLTDDGFVYFEFDSNLREFSAGVQELSSELYLALEDGYLLAPPSGEPYLFDGEVYFVQEDGTLLRSGTFGHLQFDENGRQTSGSSELDAQLDELFALCGAGEEQDPELALRKVNDYIRDNFKYLSMEHYEAGTTDWAQSAAEKFFKYKKGNCYSFAAALMYGARKLGYQAYVVAGHEYSVDNDHAWTMIDWPDGNTYLFDVQLEYAYWYMYDNKPKIDMFKTSGSDGVYNGCQYYFPEG